MNFFKRLLREKNKNKTTHSVIIYNQQEDEHHVNEAKDMEYSTETTFFSRLGIKIPGIRWKRIAKI